MACTTEVVAEEEGRREGFPGLGWRRGKKHDEEDDDKNNHTDEDNHLHVLPPELPSHLCDVVLKCSDCCDKADRDPHAIHLNIEVLSGGTDC